MVASGSRDPAGTLLRRHQAAQSTLTGLSLVQASLGFNVSDTGGRMWHQCVCVCDRTAGKVDWRMSPEGDLSQTE